MRDETTDAEAGAGADDPERRSGDAIAATYCRAVGLLQMGQGEGVGGEIVDDEQPIPAEMPAQIRDKYQYFTQASIEKLKATGHNGPMFSLEQAVADYVQNYLVPHRHLEV